MDEEESETEEIENEEPKKPKTMLARTIKEHPKKEAKLKPKNKKIKKIFEYLKED